MNPNKPDNSGIPSDVLAAFGESTDNVPQEVKDAFSVPQKKNSLPTSSTVVTPSQRPSVSAVPSTSQKPFDPATFMRQSRAAVLSNKPAQDNQSTQVAAQHQIVQKTVQKIQKNQANAVKAKPVTQRAQIQAQPDEPFDLTKSLQTDFPDTDPNEVLGNKDLLSGYYKQKNDLLQGQIDQMEASEKRGVMAGAIAKLKKEQQALTQQVYRYNSIHAGLEGGGDPTQTGIILGKAMGDPHAAQQERFMAKGIPVNPMQQVKTEDEGLGAQIATLQAQHQYDQGNPEYLAQLADLQNKKATVLERHPEALKEQWGKVIGNYVAKDLPAWQKLSGLWFKRLPDVIEKMRKDGIGVPDEVAKNISWDDVPTNMDIAGKVLEGAVGHFSEKAASLERIGGNLLGIDKDVLDSDIEQGQANINRNFGLNTPESEQRVAPQEIVQANSKKPDFLQNVPNPDAGKINPSGSVLAGEVFKNISSLATFVLDATSEAKIAGNVLNKLSPAMNIERTAALSQHIGTDATVFAGAYEGNYQKAAQIIGDNPDDEGKRNLAAILGSSIDAAVFHLPIGKYGQNLTEGKMAMGDVIKNLPANLKGLTAESLETNLKKYLQKPLAAILESAKNTTGEAVKFGAMQTAGVVLKKIAQSAVANNDESDKDWQSVPNEIADMWGSLPISLVPGVFGINLLGAGKVSAFSREAKYDAFSNPQRTLSDLGKAQEAGLITAKEFKERAEVVNVGAKILKEAPATNPETGEPLSHSQSVTWVNNRLQEYALEAKKEDIKDDKVLSKFYDSKIKELQAEREQILKPEIKPEVNIEAPVKDIIPEVKEVPVKEAVPQPKISDLTDSEVVMNGERGHLRTDEENNVVFDNGTKETLLGKTTDEKFNNSVASEHGIKPIPKIEVKGDNVKIDGEDFTLNHEAVGGAFGRDKNDSVVSLNVINNKGEARTIRDKDLALDVAIAKNHEEFSKRPEPKDYESEVSQPIREVVNEKIGKNANEIIDSMPEEVADTFAAMDNKIEALAPRETQEMVIRASEWTGQAREEIKNGSSSEKEKADAIKMLDKFDKDLNKYYGKLEKQRKNQADADVKRGQAESLGAAKQKARAAREKAKQLEIEAVEQENLATATESRNRTYKLVNEIDDPTDAQGIALQYFSGGGKVDVGEMAGEVTGSRKTTMNREGKTSDADGNTLFENNGRTVDQVAHSLWDNLPDHLRDSITDQDIRNSLIDVMSSHESRFDAAKEFVENYHFEYAEAKRNREMAERWAEYEKELKEERDAELEWLKEQANEQKEIEQTPEYIEQIIKKYESETAKPDVEQTVPSGERESAETRSPKKSAEPEGNNLQRTAEDKPEPGKGEQQSDKGKQLGKYTTKAKILADKVRNADIPSWLINNDPNIKTSGISGSTLKEALATSIEKVGELMDKGVELKEAISEGTKDILDKLRKLNGVDKLDPNFEKQVKEGFSKEAEIRFKDREGEMIGITHEKTTEIADEFGFAGYEKKPETIAQWDKEATDRIRNGYNIWELINKLEKDYQPDKVEQRIMAKYIATLKDKVNKDPSDANISELKKIIELSDIVGGREVAKSLVARKGLQPVDSSLADYFIREMEASKVDKLTDKQKATAKEEFKNIEKANKDLQEKLSKLEEENSRMKAAQALSHERKISKQVRKTSEEFSNERKAIVNDIREKLKKIRQEQNVVVVPYAKELFTIAPDVMKIVKSLVEEGVVNLADVVEKVHSTLKDDIKELTKKDVHDIIAGEYNPPKKTRNEIAATIVNLKQEAKTINNYESLVNGVVPAKESLKIERNRKITELKKKINEHDLTRLGRKKENIKSQISDLEKQLRTGNFEKPVSKQPVKLDKEGKELLDRLVKLKQDREIRLLKEQYNARSRYEIARDHVLEVLNVPRAIMASMDYSAPLRQAVVATISNPGLAAKVGRRMFEASFSQKNFDRWFFELKENPRYELMGLTKLSITDPHSPFLVAREEAYMSNLAEKIPLIGRLVKGSERAYVMYLNKMRADLFNKFADRFEEQGKTYENNKALYDKMADYINNQTGRGNLGKAEDFAPVLNSVLFSPRLIASRVNLLNPMYFAKLPKELKVMYLKDMGRFVGFGLAVLALAQYAGNDDEVTIEHDPRSSDFGKIKFGNTRWDIWGGFQQYVRVISQFATGQRKSTNTKEIQELNGKGAFGTDRVDIVGSFVRGKVAPVVSTSINLLSGRDAFGKESTLGSEAKNILFPLTLTGAKEAFDDAGIKSLFLTGIPSIFGVGTQTYESNPKKQKEVIVPYSSFQ